MEMTLTLGVADLAATEAFYRELLQLPLERLAPPPVGAPLLALRRGDALLLFRQLEVLEARHPTLFQNLARHPRGVGMTLELPLPDLRPVRRAIDRRGLHILYELEDAEHDLQEVWLHDPDGYLVILVQQSDAAAPAPHG